MAKKRKHEPTITAWVHTPNASRGRLTTPEEVDIAHGPRPRDSGAGRGDLATGTDSLFRDSDAIPLKLNKHEKDCSGRPEMTNDFLRYISAGFNASRREATVRQYLKVREVVDVLEPVGITEGMVRDLLKSKALHGNQPSQDGRWHIPLISLKQYLTSNGTYLPEQIDEIMANAAAAIQSARTTDSAKTA